MYIDKNLPHATTTQFIAAVRSMLPPGSVYKNYTDAPKNSTNKKKRYVKLCINVWRHYNLDDICKNIEFALWMQGVTANTRFNRSYSSGFVGTCVLEK